MRISVWSSDVCSSDLREAVEVVRHRHARRGQHGLAIARDRGGKRMVAEPLDRDGDAKQLFLGHAGSGHGIGDARLALGQCTRLVEGERGERSEILERPAAFREKPALGRGASRERVWTDGEIEGGAGSLKKKHKIIRAKINTKK